MAASLTRSYVTSNPCAPGVADTMGRTHDPVMPLLVSVNVGLPREVMWNGEPVTTGIFKTPVDGPVALRRHNLDGDGQADLSVHGGPTKAVYRPCPFGGARPSGTSWSGFGRRTGSLSSSWTSR
jgi:hypothetical protein